MAIPPGAHHVNYQISANSGSAEVYVPIEVDLRTSPAEADAAAKVAADAVVTHLRATLPYVSASRSYQCDLRSDDWPTAAEGGA